MPDPATPEQTICLQTKEHRESLPKRICEKEPRTDIYGTSKVKAKTIFLQTKEHRESLGSKENICEKEKIDIHLGK